MAKIAVVAANGKASRKIISEALSRGFDVTAFGRHEENNTEAKTYVRKDILDLTREDLAGFDAVVSGFGAFTPETFPLYQTTTEHLADILSGSDTRLLFVGGAGSLYTNPERTETLADGKDFPEAIRPLAQAMKKALATFVRETMSAGPISARLRFSSRTVPARDPMNSRARISR